MQRKVLTSLQRAIILTIEFAKCKQRRESDIVFKNLDAEQARNKLTNSDVANLLGISRVSYENKKKSGKFTTPEIKTLCRTFKCKFDYLFAAEEQV